MTTKITEKRFNKETLCCCKGCGTQPSILKNDAAKAIAFECQCGIIGPFDEARGVAFAQWNSIQETGFTSISEKEKDKWFAASSEAHALIAADPPPKVLPTAERDYDTCPECGLGQIVTDSVGDSPHMVYFTECDYCGLTTNGHTDSQADYGEWIELVNSILDAKEAQSKAPSKASWTANGNGRCDLVPIQKPKPDVCRWSMPQHIDGHMITLTFGQELPTFYHHKHPEFYCDQIERGSEKERATYWRKLEQSVQRDPKYRNWPVCNQTGEPLSLTRWRDQDGSETTLGLSFHCPHCAKRLEEREAGNG